MNIYLEKIQKLMDKHREKNPNSDALQDLNDGYHSFRELYKHRTLLFALLTIRLPYSWKSKFHEDGTMYNGMFVVGAPTPSGMISYHCDIEYWNLFKIPTIPKAPHFDGYTPNDVLDRLESYINSAEVNLINQSNINQIESIVEKEILPVFDNDLDKAKFISFYRS